MAGKGIMELVVIMVMVVGVVGVVVGIPALVAWCVNHYDERKRAMADLERCMDRKLPNLVRSLLVVRGQYFCQEVRDAANVWLIEQDNDSGGR